MLIFGWLSGILIDLVALTGLLGPTKNGYNHKAWLIKAHISRFTTVMWITFITLFALAVIYAK